MADEGEKGKKPEKGTRHAVRNYEEFTEDVYRTVLLDSRQQGLDIQTGSKGYLYWRRTRKAGEALESGTHDDAVIIERSFPAKGKSR